MTWHQHAMVIFLSDLRRRTHQQSTKSFWNKCCHVTNRKHKYYWNHGRSTYQLRAATRPLFLLATRCRAGELFEYGRHAIRPLRVLIGRRALWPLPAVHLPPNVSMAPEHLFYGVAICLTGLRFKREKWKSEKKVLHGSWCKIQWTYIASTATYSKTGEYIRTTTVDNNYLT